MNTETCSCLERLAKSSESIAKNLSTLAEDTRADKNFKKELYEAVSGMQSELEKLKNFPK